MFSKLNGNRWLKGNKHVQIDAKKKKKKQTKKTWLKIKCLLMSKEILVYGTNSMSSKPDIMLASISRKNVSLSFDVITFRQSSITLWMVFATVCNVVCGKKSKIEML